jgi:adenine-specific DNA methylase
MEKNLLERKVPVELLNQEARKEKLAIPPISEMHYYFTRKPLICARMSIAGAILGADAIRESEDFNRLVGIDPSLKKRAFKNIPIELINKINSKYPDGIMMLDPFGGGGMIPFEAIRMGLNVTAMDYSPVSYLIMKGTIEYPLKYGRPIDEKTGESRLYADVKKYSEQIFRKLNSEYSYLYPMHGTKHVRAYIHAWAVECPTCGKTTPLVNNWWLDSKEKTRLDYKIRDACLEFSIVKNSNLKEGNIKGGHATCLYCAADIANEKIMEDISKNERELILAVYLDDRSFELPLASDINAMEGAKKYLQVNSAELSKFIPSEALPMDIRSKRYLSYFYRLFNPRQLLVLSSFAKEARKIVEELSKQDREYATVIGTYLSMILSKHVNYNSRCTCWHNSFRKIAHSLTNRGISMMWTHAETNPFEKFSGSLISNIHDVLLGLKFATDELNRNTLDKRRKPTFELHQGSILSWVPGKKFKFIITDPPYYDDVQYPELMQFFQVWHSRIVGDFLGIPATPSTSEELSVSRTRDAATFEKRLFIAVKRLYDALEDDGVLVMFYVHSSIEGWKYLLESLRKTGFHVTSTITLMTESEGNVIARGNSSIFHSLVITARKRQGNKTASIIEVEEEVRKKIEENYQDLEKTYGKDRMNLMVAASGMVIETITQYSSIKSFTKNTADYALEIGQRFLIEAFARRTLDIDRVDSKTIVYSWFRHSLRDSVDYSEFNQTLKALGTTEDAIADIIERPTKDRSKVRLLDFTERGALEIDGMEPLIAQSIIDAVHIVLRGYMRGGLTATKEAVNSSPFGRKTILNMIEALGKIYLTRPSYKEGEICKKFIEEWNGIYGNGQKELH